MARKKIVSKTFFKTIHKTRARLIILLAALVVLVVVCGILLATNFLMLAELGYKKLTVGSTVVTVITGVALLALMVSISIQYDRFLKRTEHPIDNLHKAINELAKGNFEQEIKAIESDDLDTLFEDIERLRLELKSGREAEEKLSQKEKSLLASISHDLKTPIAVISGAAESIKDDVGDIDENVDVIISKSQLLSSLINDILDYTKTELNEFPLAVKEVSGREFFERELHAMRSLASAKDITFVADAAPEVVLKIDVKRTSQVIQNIVDNSIKFTDKSHGKIMVSFKQIPSFLVVTISDNGAGIPTEDLPNVFDKFYRGEKSRSSATGSGLGLSIAKYIVEKQGGKIECDSQINEGTSVTFSLPIKEII